MPKRQRPENRTAALHAERAGRVAGAAYHVSAAVAANTEPAPLRENRPELPEYASIGRGGVVERWLDKRLNLVVAAVVAAGFVARVIVAGRSYLNPDEALHYIIVNQRSAFLAYKVSLTNAHPPLIYLLVYYFRFLGRSELMLRLPSVLAGTALCWVAYKWVVLLFGRAAGAISVILTAFLPAMIALSAELRSYALLLFCETTALYFLEMALREHSVRKMWYFSLFLYLAILSHYSALFFALAVGAYALVRILASGVARKVIVAWAAGQAVALAIYAFLYVTHISRIKTYIGSWVAVHDQVAPYPDRHHLFKFTWERTIDIFSFLFENRYVAWGLLLLCLVGGSLLILRELVSHAETLRARHVGILMSLPFIAVWAAGIAGFYPYVGTRHTVFLAPFLIAALSCLLATGCRQRVWAALVTAALLAGAANASGEKIETFITKENQSRTLMAAALSHIRQTIPPRDVILADYQSAIILVYYLCGPQTILPVGTFNLPASRVRCNGYTIGSFQTWSLEPAFFLSNFEKMVQAQRLKSGDRVWVFESGWGVSLGEQLPWTSAKFHCLAPKNFGANISVIPFLVDQDLSPAATVTNCA